jgi:hypothetical protein
MLHLFYRREQIIKKLGIPVIPVRCHFIPIDSLRKSKTLHPKVLEEY